MFSHNFSSLTPATRKAIYLICLAVGVVGVSYGSLATAYGFPLWVPLFSSLFVLAGASEFMFIAIIASGGNPLAAAAAGRRRDGGNGSRHCCGNISTPARDGVDNCSTMFSRSMADFAESNGALGGWLGIALVKRYVVTPSVTRAAVMEREWPV